MRTWRILPTFRGFLYIEFFYFFGVWFLVWIFAKHSAAVVMWKRDRGEVRNIEIISLDVAFVDKWFKPKVKSAMISQGFGEIFKKNWQKMTSEEGVLIVQTAMGMPQVQWRRCLGTYCHACCHSGCNAFWNCRDLGRWIGKFPIASFASVWIIPR